MKAILLLGHGSKAEGANQSIYLTAELIREQGGYDIVECAFLSLNPPYIHQGIERCIAQGAKKIILVPYFLLSGEHVRRDLPDKVRQEKIKYPEIDIALAPPIGFHPKLAEIILERIKEVDGQNK
jgi:sirohydrochlorin ferrochelatase